MCEARRIPCTAHLELLDARELIAAGLHGIEHVTSFGVSLLPRIEAEAYRQAVLKNNDARRDGRYRLFAGADLDGPAGTGAVRRAARTEAVSRCRRWRSSNVVRLRRLRQPASGAASAADASRISTPMLVAGFAKMKQLTRRAAREGARVVVGGHTEVPFAGRGEAPWREMELLVESGFSPLEAISAATTTAAAFLYRGNQLGSLRAGLQRRSRRPARATRPRHLGHPDRRPGDGRRPMDRHGEVSAVLRPQPFDVD